MSVLEISLMTHASEHREILQHREAHFLTLFRVELGREDVVLPDHRAERVRVVSLGRDDCAVHRDGAVVIGHAHGWYIHCRDAVTWPAIGPPSTGPTTGIVVVDANILAVGIGDRLRATPGMFELWDLKAKRRIKPFFQEPNGV